MATKLDLVRLEGKESRRAPMTARLTAITLLLRELTSLELAPRSWSDLLNRQSRSGEGPSTRIDCASCNGEGAVRRRGIAYPCETCKARGWLVVDAYTERPIGTAETGTILRLKALRCDSCAGQGVFGNQHRCQRCSGSGWVEIPLERLAALRAPLTAEASEYGLGDPVVAALEAGFAGLGRSYQQRRLAGDFEQLGLALAALRLELPLAYRTVVRVYVEALFEPDKLGEQQQLRHDVGLGYLGRLMPDEIRVPSWAARNERRRRDLLKRNEVAA